MHFSNFQNQDKNHVINLFEKVFEKKITEEFWNWRYGMSPFGKPIESLLWAENKLIGYYMINPLPMKINDHLENILLSMSMMIHPDYQYDSRVIPLAVELIRAGLDAAIVVLECKPLTS